MRSAKYKYQVYDNGVQVIKDGTPAQVESMTGLQRGSITHYLGGKLYKNRFTIVGVEVQTKPKKEKPLFINKKLSPKDMEVMAKYNRTMKYLRENYPEALLRRILIVKEEKVS